MAETSERAEPCDITPGMWCAACVPESLRDMFDCEVCKSPNECAAYGCADKSTVLSVRRSSEAE